MTAAFAVLVIGGIVLPYLLPLGRVTPRLAVAVWLAALGLRALFALLVITVVIAFAPTTGLFTMLTRWCWHIVPPLLPSHLGLSGHAVGHAATVTPAAILAGSGLSAAWAILRAARAVGEAVRDCALGHGPRGTVIVGGREAMIAAAGLRQPKIIVSAGALTTLDDAELAASIEHERGHVTRRHRYMLLGGEACRAISCLLPGGRRALSELAFHLERDADEYALLQRQDRLALASAICKALPAPRSAKALMPLGGGPSALQRVRTLVDGPARHSRGATRAAAICGTVMTSLVLALAASLPAYAAAGAAQLAKSPVAHSCPG